MQYVRAMPSRDGYLASAAFSFQSIQISGLTASSLIDDYSLSLSVPVSRGGFDIQRLRAKHQRPTIAQFAVRFEKIAEEHKKSAAVWLVAAGLLALGTAGIAIGFLTWLPALGELSQPDTIQRIVTKLVILSLAYFAAIWSSRNYRSHRHLQVVNSHRQNALTTFKTFVKAAGDEDKETKNAVLMEATRCIFSPSVTGYLGNDQEMPSNSIVEVLTKTVGGVAGK